MLGHTLARIASERHEVWGSYRSFPVSIPHGQSFALELTDAARVGEWVRRLKPDAVIHTAALTDVDQCERDRPRALRVNVEATRCLALLAGELGAGFVYISTDYVFNGQRGDYAESDPPSPISVYGETKLFGEEAARLSCPKALILRTAIFGYNIQPKKGQVESIIDSLENGRTLSRFTDQFSTPIYTGDLSRLILELLERGLTGIFHVGGGEKISRYDLALKTADCFGLPRELIRPVGFEQLKGRAARPRDSSLRGDKVEAALEKRLPKVGEGLERLKSDLGMLRKSKGAG